MLGWLTEIKNRTLWRKANLFLTYAVVFSFPFPLYISLKILALWIFTSVVIFDIRSVKESRHKLYFIIVSLYYLVFVLGMLYTQDINGGLHQLSMKIYIVLFPFLFASVDVMYKRYFDRILAWYVLGQVASVIVLLLIAFYSSVDIENGHIIFDPRIDKHLTLLQSFSGTGNYFFYNGFACFLHPLYASYQIVFAIAVLVFLKRNPYGLKYGKITQRMVEGKFFYFVFAFLVMSVFIYGSRTNMISLSVLLFLSVLYSSIRPFVLRLVLALVVLSISVGVMMYNPRSQKLAKSVENYEQLTWKEKLTRFSRVYFWISAYEIGREHIVLGVGTGDLQWHLYRKYAKMNMVRFLEPSFNSHNEFLEHFGRLGLIGLGLLLAMLIYAFVIGLWCKRRVLLIFIIITVINFMFEVLLNRVWGTTFFAFFFNFLLLLDFKDKTLPRIRILNGRFS